MRLTVKKAKLYPNKGTKELLNKTFGCCRFVWNTLLAENIQAYDLWKEMLTMDKNFPKPKVDFYSLSARLTNLKNEYEWLREVSAVALQQSIRNLATAFTNFFKYKKEFPQFKSKHDKNSFRIVDHSNIRIDVGYAHLPKTEHPTKFLPKYDLEEVSSYTVVKDKVGDYFINMVTKEELLDSDKTCEAVGIDLGIKSFAIVKHSDGSISEIPNNRFYTKLQHQRTKLARRLAKKQKGSGNRNKARITLAKLERKITNCRKDFLHKESTKLIIENQVICLEDLNVSGMMKNHKLAKHIQDSGWSMFKAMFEYKALRYFTPKTIVTIDRWFPSSNICSNCNTKREIKLQLSERSWYCFSCNTNHDRDENAANNILKRGLLLV